MNELQFFETSRITHPRTQHHIPEVLNLLHYIKVQPQTPIMAWRGSRGIALLFFNFGARCEVVINSMPWTLYPRERDPIPTVQVAGKAPRLVWTGAENLAPTRIWSLGSPASSRSLYQLLSQPTQYYSTMHNLSFAKHVLQIDLQIFNLKHGCQTTKQLQKLWDWHICYKIILSWVLLSCTHILSFLAISRSLKPSATLQYVEWDLRTLNADMTKDGHTITIHGLAIDS